MSGDGGDKWISRGNRRELCRTGVMTMVSETFECARTGAVHDFITVDLIDWVVIVAETPGKGAGDDPPVPAWFRTDRA